MRILIVDDEVNIRELMKRFLGLEGIDADSAENGFSAQRMLSEQAYDACIVDLKMPGMDGIELIQWIRSEGFRMPVIMASAHGEISDAVQALKDGAQDYVVKPFDPVELTVRIKNLVEAQNLRNIKETENRQENERSFVGESVQIKKINELISRIAATNSTVLITGDSGTGKEVVARTIHARSGVLGPFVPINIGGVPENLLESELFGYEKGAFTGAVSRKQGMFELASGGTLFLDEIGEMPLALQVKILRVLQERCITRLGGTSTIPINARIICATNRNLEEDVREGRFREDLFYRLNVVRIQIPPLRERREDIPVLSHFILQKLNTSMGRHFTGFTPRAMEMLKNHSFYGNVRELENILERAAIFADGELITENELDLRGSSLRQPDKEHEAHQSTSEPLTLADAEKAAIEKALRRWEGNRTRAAEELGISRRTLITKIQEYNIEI